MEFYGISKGEYLELDYLIHKRILFLISPEIKKRKSIKNSVKDEINLLDNLKKKLQKITINSEMKSAFEERYLESILDDLEE